MPSAMIIAFDAKRAYQNATGLGSYSRLVLRLLARYAPENRYLLLQPRMPAESLLPQLPANFSTLTPAGGFWRLFPSLWRSYGITAVLRRHGVQLYHGLSAELPLNIARARGCATVVTVHDLIFMRCPQYYQPADRAIYTHKLQRACRAATAIVAVSECTKRDLVELLGVAPERVRVLYQGYHPQFAITATPEARAQAREEYHLPPRYVLYVGTVEARKNLLLLAQALEYLPDPIPVVVVGRPTPYVKEVKAFLAQKKLTARMHFLNHVPFEHLPTLYQMAELFVYPSRYEGFGIPLLEALASGVPVIGAKGSCLEEAGGPHSLYVDPDDPHGLADAMARVLADEKLRTEMVLQGHQWVHNFSDERLAHELIALYRELVEGSTK